MISTFDINPSLSYSMGGLNLLKSKLYQLLAQAYEQGGQVSLTVEDIRILLRDLDFAEKKVQEIIENIYEKGDKNQ